MKKLTDESESDRNVCDDEESNNEGIDKIERVGQCSFQDKTQKTMKSPDIKKKTKKTNFMAPFFG